MVVARLECANMNGTNRILKIVRIGCFLLLLCNLTGCLFQSPKILKTAASKAETIQPVYTPPNPNVKATPSTEEIITRTSTIAPILTPTLAITAAPQIDMKENCLTILPELPKDINLKGGIILENHGGADKNYLYDLETKTEKVISISQSDRFFRVSPDGKWYAYEDLQNKLVRVFSSDQKLIRIIGLENSWGVYDWLNNEILLIMGSPEGDTGSGDLAIPFIAINPFTNQRTTLEQNYPGINHMDWPGAGNTVYNPQLTMVVYYGNFNEGADRGAILWDMRKKKSIAKIPNTYNSGPPYSAPIWSPDGSKFIYTNDNDEVMLANDDGSVSQITYLNKDGFQFSPNFFSWSPDEEKIAFWLNNNNLKRESLAVLDLSTGEITDYCITAGYDPSRMVYDPAPEWSQDGNFLVMEANYLQEIGGSDVVIVDMSKNLAAKIEENFIPMGFLVGIQ